MESRAEQIKLLYEERKNKNREDIEENIIMSYGTIMDEKEKYNE